jgi:hypothetical protein
MGRNRRCGINRRIAGFFGKKGIVDSSVIPGFNGGAGMRPDSYRERRYYRYKPLFGEPTSS